MIEENSISIEGKEQLTLKKKKNYKAFNDESYIWIQSPFCK